MPEARSPISATALQPAINPRRLVSPQAPMPSRSPSTAELPAGVSRLRRFTGWIGRFGALRATLLLSLISSLGSLGITWLLVSTSNSPAMGNAIWISLLVPIPLTLVFGGICISLVISLGRAWDEIHDLAMRDTLTGLNNRTHFMPAAQRELDLARRHSQPLALLVLDVDHFKNINDTMGHLGGDEVLVQVAKRCAQALRTTDLLARWGGEEFIMLLPNTQLGQARQLAERVRESLQATPVVVRGRTIVVTASLGAAGVLPGHATSLEQLIRRADDALYLAKSTGRNKVSICSRRRAKSNGRRNRPKRRNPWINAARLPLSATDCWRRPRPWPSRSATCRPGPKSTSRPSEPTGPRARWRQPAATNPRRFSAPSV